MRRRDWFIATGTPPLRVDPETVAAAASAQQDHPRYVTTYSDRSYWWHQDAFYWTNCPELTGEDIKALLFARERRQKRELEHAHAVLAAASALLPERKRQPIPRDVKLAVFQRDEGACVECASNFDIQYDHIIPFSMGGSNTADNLQLLCGRCNQKKGGRL